jgi:hypothetical protein
MKFSFMLLHLACAAVAAAAVTSTITNTVGLRGAKSSTALSTHVLYHPFQLMMGQKLWTTTETFDGDDSGDRFGQVVSMRTKLALWLLCLLQVMIIM